MAAALALAAAVTAVLAGGGQRHDSAPAAAAGARISVAGRPPGNTPSLAARAWALGASGANTAASAVALRPTRALSPAAGTPCGQTPGLLCSDVVVPLDRSGQVPGTITLKVETLPAFGTQRGVMFLIAGGPGQGSASVFGLREPSSAEYYRFLFPGYALVAFDNRGTGQSGLLRCSGLQGYYPIEQEAARVGSCAGVIGTQRVFYSTREHAEDIEAVRQSLGATKVALWGTSYGTKLAVGYALAHPANVDRLLLDSVVPTDLDDPFRATSLREIPKALQEFCAAGCGATTASFAADVATVLNRLAAKPAQVKVLLANGKQKNLRITGLDALSVVIDSDLNPGFAAALPAAMRAARAGDMQPLARLFDLDVASNQSSPEDLSGGLFAATVCNDGPLPWPADAPVSGRKALFDRAVNALPAGRLGPFGKWAAQIGNGHFCLAWPPPSGNVALGAGPLPNVPVLAVNGGYDMRTPTASAIAVVSKFPQGQLIVVPAVGHSVLGADPSFCAARAVRAWMLGTPFSTQCARPAPFVNTTPAFPVARRTPAGAAATLAVASKTLRDAQAVWMMTQAGAPAQVAGLYRGRLVGGEDGFRLVRYSIAPGVELSGTLRVTGFGPPYTFEGAVTVSGKLAAPGVLGLSTRGTLAGTLGGQLVG
jgi:pimeloyl-ACP methyl ester carboxylesterase